MVLPRGCLKPVLGVIALFLMFLAFAGLPEIFPDNGVVARAIYEGDVERVRALLERGADPNSRSATLSELCWWLGKPRGHRSGYAPDFGEQQHLLLLALDKGQIEIARLLVEHGADPDVHDEWDFALGEAVALGEPGLVRLMLEKGADPNKKMADGATALHFGRDMRFAARSTNPEIVRLVEQAAKSRN